MKTVPGWATLLRFPDFSRRIEKRLATLVNPLIARRKNSRQSGSFAPQGFKNQARWFCFSVVYSVLMMKRFRFLIAICLLCGNAFAETNAISSPTLLHGKGVENFFQLNDRVYSGSAPEGAEGFAELKKRGIKTIITVDGAKPDIATAKQFGLRYVHIPFGYDSVPTNQALKLVKAAEELPKPIFIHCHHGLHRGPAGAAIICEGTQAWTPAQAIDWMKTAGTSTNYLGLFKSVEEFHRPTDTELKSIPATFPETAEISPLADSMVTIDERFDHLKMLQKAGYKETASHPDLVPAHEALLLEEAFTELLRTSDFSKQGQGFQEKMQAAQTAARELHRALSVTPLMTEPADVAFKNVNNACASCHTAYRNVHAATAAQGSISKR